MNYSFRKAEASDAERITTLIDAAYSHYVEHLGVLPGPMAADYAHVIRDHSVSVAESDGSVIAVIVLSVTDEGFLIDNVAVHRSHFGRRPRTSFARVREAEAKRAGFDSIYPFTHEKMTENLALYSNLGYLEYDRRSLSDFCLSTCASGSHESRQPGERPKGGIAWSATP